VEFQVPELDVFVSWSGTLSHDVAKELSVWFPTVLPGVKPWISSEGIAKGKPWFGSVAAQLGKSPVCLICVTAKNVRAPWLYYEAGAIAFALNDPYVCPFLVDTGTDSIGTTPFGQLQVTKYDREDVFRLIKSVNTRLETPHAESLLKATFDKKWPGLKKKIDKLLADQPKDTPPPAPPDSPPISPIAVQILIQTASGERHTITVNHSAHGFNLQAGGKDFANKLKDERREAEFRAAVNELVNRGLIADKGTKGEVFGVTASGYALADEAKQYLPAELSDEAKAILLSASTGKDGQVMGHQTFEGFHLSSGGTQVCSSDDDRIVSGFREALDDLVERGYLSVEGEDNYQITRAGYKASESLAPLKAAAPPITDEADILVHLQGWMHKNHSDGKLTPPIVFADVDRELNLLPGSAVRLLERAAMKLNWAPDSKGPTVIVFKRFGAPGSAPIVINRI